MKFGEYLVQNEYLTLEQLRESLELQLYSRKRIGRIAKELGFLSLAHLNQALNQFFYRKGAEVSETSQVLQVDPELLRRLQLWCESKPVMFTRLEGERIWGVTHQYRDELMEEFERRFELEVHLHSVDWDYFEYLRKTQTRLLSPDEAQSTKKIPEAKDSVEEDAYAKLFWTLLKNAHERKASDIHFEPTREGVSVRFRILGEMLLIDQINTQHRQPFLQEAKRLCRLPISVSGIPQDSRLSIPTWNLDIRVNLIPSQYGNKLVLRLLDLNRKFQLEKMNFDPGILKDLRKALAAETGLVVVSGPTGSGKTTTLNAMISEINTTKVNIITLEDPVEYTLPGVTQVQITPKLSFANALRAVLRQDPDVILVGEIRDEETAELCLKAASTGHLVLSTVHANSAIEVMGRILNLGVSLDVLANNLRFSAAQRLVALLCENCKIPHGDFYTRNEKGCSQCHFGFSQQKPLMEYLTPSELIDYFGQKREHNRTHVLPRHSLEAELNLLVQKGEVDANSLMGD